MTIEQKIREAYELALKNDPYMSSLVVFTGGYKAALDALISVGHRNAPYYKNTSFYASESDIA